MTTPKAITVIEITGMVLLGVFVLALTLKCLNTFLEPGSTLAYMLAGMSTFTFPVSYGMLLSHFSRRWTRGQKQ